jgi:membrane protein DedA with SNARE-associated domain
MGVTIGGSLTRRASHERLISVTLEGSIQAVIEFVRVHEAWAPPIVFALAFGECLAFISLLLPATVILIAIGGMIGTSGIALFPIWLAAVLGSIVGYGLSYWIGVYFKDDIIKLWPFSKYPEMVPRGRAFFEKYGALGVFLGHFFGPLRAVVPVVAGVYAMPQIPFQAANIASALVWATAMLAPGYLGLKPALEYFGISFG